MNLCRNTKLIYCYFRCSSDATETTVAYMYDLCLKRLTKKSKRRFHLLHGKDEKHTYEDDPHFLIQQVLLNEEAMPALKYFITTYGPLELSSVQNCSDTVGGVSMHTDKKKCAERECCDFGEARWRLVHQKKLPCSTDSYMFYVYERI